MLDDLPAQLTTQALRWPPYRLFLLRAKGLVALATGKKSEALRTLQDALKTSRTVWGDASHLTGQLQVEGFASLRC